MGCLMSLITLLPTSLLPTSRSVGRAHSPSFLGFEPHSASVSRAQDSQSCGRVRAPRWCPPLLQSAERKTLNLVVVCEPHGGAILWSCVRAPRWCPPLLQSAERKTLNLVVVCSSPTVVSFQVALYRLKVQIAIYRLPVSRLVSQV